MLKRIIKLKKKKKMSSKKLKLFKVMSGPQS
jgi:hypothetical protein